MQSPRSKIECLMANCCIAITILGLSSCQPATSPDESSTLKVNLEIQPSPPQVGEAEVQIQLADDTGTPISGATVELEGNMNHAGMKPVFSQLKETTPGRYEGTLEFTMGGDWYVMVTGRLPDGESLNEKIEVPGVKTQ